MGKIAEWREAGFNETEINDYVAKKSAEWTSAGFDQKEIAQYLGLPTPPNDNAIRQVIKSNLDAATAPGPDGQRKPLDWKQSIEAGFQISVGVPGGYGLAGRGKMPDLEMTGNESTFNRYLNSAATMIGDIPAMLAGGALAGGTSAETGPLAPVIGTAAAFAMPAALRGVMIDAYKNGEFKTPGEFMERASGILLDTAKAYVTGAATGGAGAVAGKVLQTATPAVRSVGQLTSEIGAMVTVGKTLDNQPIHLQDFWDAGVLMAAFKGAGAVTGYSAKAAKQFSNSLMETYKKTGVTPDQVVADARTDPTIIQDMATGREIPRAYEDQVDPIFKPEEVAQPEPLTDGATAGGTNAPGVTAPPPITPQQVMTQRQALETMAANLGIQVKLTPGPDFHSSTAGYVNVPPEGKVTTVPSLTDSEFIFAHELGHAIMITRRGAIFGRQREDGKFSYWSNAKLRREISNWDEFTDASKEMRPEFWNDPALGQQKYVRTPDELVADTIAAVLTGKRDISILYPMMKAVGIKPEGLGLASDGNGGGRTPGGFPQPAAGTPEPGSLAEAQRTILEKVNIGGESAGREPMTLEKLYTSALDDLAPLQRIVDEMAQGKDLPASKDPYKMARLLRGGFGKAQAALELSTFDFGTLDNNGKSLKAVMEPVRGELDAFRAYAIAARAMELKDRFIVSGFDVDAAAKVLKESDPKFKQVMTELVEYQNRITAYLKDSGVLSDEAYAAMLEANKNYVPFYRMLGEEPGAKGAGAGLSTRNPIKTIKGSGMDIIDPVESIIKNTYTYLTLADRNAALREFYLLGKKSGMSEMFFEKAPADLRATTVSDAEMAKFLKENGINKMPQDALTVFRAMRRPLAADEIGFFMDGKWTVLRVFDQDVAAALKATDRQSLGMLWQFLAAPAKMLRAGVTIAPDFIARNFVRDQFSATINSEYGFMPILSTLSGAASILKKDAAYENWLKSGGANSALVSLDRTYIQSEIYKLVGQNPEANFLDKTWNVAARPIEWLRITSELIENATRMGEFKAATKQLGESKGAIMDAGFASREVTLDFARMGANAKAMSMITAFFNAGAQGIDRTVRTIKDDPMGSMTKIGLMVTLPSVLLWAANKDDPRWKEIPDWQRDLFWIVMTNDHVFRIPKPPILGVLFGSSVERMLDATAGKMDERDLKQFLKSVAGEFTANIVPTVGAPMLEHATNHSFFTGHGLVPSYLEDSNTGVIPEMRYTEYTSELTKKLGHILGTVPLIKDTSMASPIVIDNYIRSWTGGMGAYAIQSADYSLRKFGVLPDPVKPADTWADIPVIKAFVVRYPSATAESIQRFQDDYKDRKLLLNSFKKLAQQGDFDAANRIMQVDPQAFVKLEGIDKVLNDHKQLITYVNQNKLMDPDQKRQIIDAAYYNMIQMTKMGNQLMKQINDVLPKKSLSN